MSRWRPLELWYVVALLSGEGTCCSMLSPLWASLCARHASISTFVLLWIGLKPGGMCSTSCLVVVLVTGFDV